MAPNDLPESPLLSGSQREFLENGQTDDPDESRKRYRTRKRVREIIIESHRLLKNWPLSEIKTTFSDPDDELEQGIKSIIALFYLANHQRDFETLIEGGVYYGEQRMNSDVFSVDCEISFLRKETTTDPDSLKQKMDTDGIELTAEEKGIVLEHIDSGEISEEYFEKLRTS